MLRLHNMCNDYFPRDGSMRKRRHHDFWRFSKTRIVLANFGAMLVMYSPNLYTGIVRKLVTPRFASRLSVASLPVCFLRTTDAVVVDRDIPRALPLHGYRPSRGRHRRLLRSYDQWGSFFPPKDWSSCLCHFLFSLAEQVITSFPRSIVLSSAIQPWLKQSLS